MQAQLWPIVQHIPIHTNRINHYKNLLDSKKDFKFVSKSKCALLWYCKSLNLPSTGVQLVQSFFFFSSDLVKITEKKSTCALVRAPSWAPLLYRECSSDNPSHTWKVSYADITQRLQAPATPAALFSSTRGSSHSWKDNKMRMNLQSRIKDKRK